MAYEIISQNNNTTTLSDGTNTITVPARVTLATSTSYTITEVNNNTATLEGSDGSVIRDVPCVAVLAGGGSSDTHNKGFFATQAALEEAYPTGEAGDYAIVGATDTVWIWDEDSSAWVDTDTKGQVESVNGKTGTVVLNASDVDAIQQYTTMPTAVDTDTGRIVQYVGTTSGSYTNGYFYVGKVSATPSQATITQTVGNSLSNLLVDKSAFGVAVSGESGTYVFTYDGEYWNINSTRARLTDYGISYTGTPVTDDAITVVYNATVFLYYWDRTDVQPSGLPSQTGNSGKFLTTDGSSASWTSSLQIGNAVKVSNSSTAMGALTVVVGGNASATQNGAISIGYGSTSSANMGVAVGPDSAVASTYGCAYGYGARIGNSATHAVQIGSTGSATTNSDANTFKVANENGNFEIMSADGTIPADRLPNAINKYSTMPTAASTNEGWIVQYTGATDANYTHGYVYECVSDGQDPATYSWVQTNVQPAPSGLPSQTGNSGKFLTTDGTDASWSDKPLVNNANFNKSIAVGYSAAVSATESVAIGPSTRCNGQYSVALGDSARAYGKSVVSIGSAANANHSNSNNYSVAIGAFAATSAAKCIQLNMTNADYRTNSTSNTLKVGNDNGNFEIMSANGTIPTDRFTTTPVADGTYVPTLTISSGTATRTWGAAASAPVVPATMPTLAVADWSSNTQTVNVTGVTASNIVFVSPAPASAADYAAAGIVCTAQGSGTLTFTCTTVPSNAITVNVVILG